MRAFVAVELPPAVRAGVGRVQAALRADVPRADVRWTAPDAFHVTLKFLGSVEDARVAAVRDALATVAAAGTPLACATGAPGAFPGVERARVLWLGVSDAGGGMARLAAAVDAALAPLGFPVEARPFHAHVTLGRVRSPRGLGPLARALAGTPPGPALAWTADEMVLFQSHTRPTGAVYEPVAHVPLGVRG